ncbi:VOC family protein [Salinifilum ghardaiensis]
MATVGAFVLIEGGDEDLRPFRSTTGTLLVDDVQPYYDRLVAEGAEIIFPLQHVPTGAAFNARHPDGTVVEYVHHRPTGDER